MRVSYAVGRHFNSGCALAAVVSLLATACAPAAPSLDLGETSVHVGDLVRGQKIRHRFSFRNVGSATLLLEVGENRCPCTGVPGYSRSLSPGESGFIDVELDTTTVAEGPISGVRASLHTNDPYHSEARFLMAARVRSEYQLLDRRDLVRRH